MTMMISLNDSNNSVQGRETTETYRKANASSVGKPLQVEGSELPTTASLKRLVEPEKLEQLRNQLNSLTQLRSSRVAFEIADESQQMVLKVVDMETGDVIRQIPEEQLLELREMMREGLDSLDHRSGLLIQTDT